MKKIDLREIIMRNSRITLREADKIVEDILKEQREKLLTEGKLRLIGLGNLEIKVRKERKGRNPSTGEEIIIPEGKRVAFKTTAKLKEEIK